jgi:hypothetical protein
VTALIIIVSILAYLGIGYGWAMLFIHTLTDGYWRQTGPYTGNTYRTKMGTGTALFSTALWPLHILLCLLLLSLEVFDADFWKRLYRL